MCVCALQNLVPQPGSRVVTVLGAPLVFPRVARPSEAELRTHMEVYIAALTALYYQHAPACNGQPRELIVT